MDTKTRKQISKINAEIVDKLTSATNEIISFIHGDKCCDYIRIVGLADNISILARQAHEIIESDDTDD